MNIAKWTIQYFGIVNWKCMNVICAIVATWNGAVCIRTRNLNAAKHHRFSAIIVSVDLNWKEHWSVICNTSIIWYSEISIWLWKYYVSYRKKRNNSETASMSLWPFLYESEMSIKKKNKSVAKKGFLLYPLVYYVQNDKEYTV